MKQATILQKELEDLKEKFANTMNILRKRENDNINQQQVFAGLSAQLENAQKENIALKQKLETLSKEYEITKTKLRVLRSEFKRIQTGGNREPGQPTTQ
jgi:chromosome segregation ATPase